MEEQVVFTWKTSPLWDVIPHKKDVLRMYLMPDNCEEETEIFYRIRQSLQGHGPAKALGALVSAWLDKCGSSHTECRRSDPTKKPSSGWPRRLLDLTNYRDGFSKSTVKVVETNGQSPPYCALSYRWSSRQKTLTPKNLLQLVDGIGVEELSSTICDACTLTKHAGIQYLWVDALCIAQGPGGDWYEEAQNMASIYTNAVFTFSIMGEAKLETTPPMKSFFSEPGQLVAYAKDRNFSWDHPESIYKLLMNTANFVARENTALDERGWVFQEKMMSRRMVTLTTSDIFWDCLHHSASGRRPAGIMGDFLPGFRDTDDREFKRLLHQPGLPHSHQDHYWFWRKAVQDYTKREFSYKRDRFIAINGIITQLGQILNDKCYLGIWGKDTLRSLIWFVGPDHYDHHKVITSPKDELLPIKAPSWSWMSISGPISYRLWHPYARYLDQRKEELIPLSRITGIYAKAESLTEFHQFAGSLCFNGSVVDGYVVGRRLFIRKRATGDPVVDALLASPKITDVAAMIREDEIRPFHEKRFHETVFLKDPRPMGEDRERLLTMEKSRLGNRLPAREIPNKRTATTDTYIDREQSDTLMSDVARRPLPVMVKCLLLCEANYSTPLAAQYCMVVTQPKRLGFANASCQRIGLCAIDSQQVCVRSHGICDKPHSFSGRMEQLTVE